MSNNDLKFHVIQIPSERVTVGYIPTVTPQGLNIRFAVAWTNPKDNYVKSRGRQIVAGRLNVNKKVYNLLLPNTDYPTKAHEYRAIEEKIKEVVFNNMPKQRRKKL
jgi:hypothetical protein